MRTFKLLAVVPFISWAVLSCGTPQQPAVPEIQIPDESQEFFVSGIDFDAGVVESDDLNPGADPTNTETQTREVHFTATDQWSAEIEDETRSFSWITVSPLWGGPGNIVLTIIVQPNMGMEDRGVKITIVCGSDRRSFWVRQRGRKVVFSVAGPVEDLPAEGGRFQMRVASNVPWNVTSDASWLTPNLTSGYPGVTYLSLVVQANNTGDTRRTPLLFLYAGRSFMHTLSQKGRSGIGSFTGAIADWEDESAQFNRDN